MLHYSSSENRTAETEEEQNILSPTASTVRACVLYFWNGNHCKHYPQHHLQVSFGGQHTLINVDERGLLSLPKHHVIILKVLEMFCGSQQQRKLLFFLK